MNKIEMGKKYRTRTGLPARVIATDVKDSIYRVVALVGKDVERVYHYTTTGHSLPSSQHGDDLVEVSPYEDFKIDDKVLVRDYENEEWNKRYFAGISADGLALAFVDGQTSWSSSGGTAKWGCCIKADQD